MCGIALSGKSEYDRVIDIFEESRENSSLIRNVYENC